MNDLALCRTKFHGGIVNTARRARRASGRTRLALVAGVAVLATVTAPLATASAVAPAVRAGAENPAPVTVVQETGEIATGDVAASQVRFTAELPAGFTGTVKAQLALDEFPEGGDPFPSRTMGNFTNTSCLVDGVPGSPCRFFGGTTPETEFTLYLDMPAATVAPAGQGRKVTWVLRTNAPFWAAEFMKGKINLTDASGRALAGAPVKLDFVMGRSTHRPTFYGRDAAGVLWQYESDGKLDSAAYQPRTRIGGGWNAYDTITRLGSSYVGSGAKGAGTDLVARDAAGQLWYYQQSGDPAAPFRSRKPVGGGWGQYTSIVGVGDVGLDKTDDLLARDRDGILWFYRGTGNPDRPFEGRVRVGGGWNQYTSLVPFPDGILAKDAAGTLWHYQAKRSTAAGTVPLEPRRKVGTGFGAFTGLAYGGMKTGRYTEDLLARDRDGKLWMYQGTSRGLLTGKRVLVGGGWNVYGLLI
ncbi:hypothetical protein [Streptomyces sp. NBC_00096]|uniref:hypothetical protein n=1 Tax=Streptomyces sp. NBC_00096 TaxID=2975650 RepID=UPI003253C80C